MTIIDANQHVRDPTRARYDWLTAELAPLNRPIGFDELCPALREAGVDATVLVESADNDDDTNLMLRTAETNTEIATIVAYVPLERPAAAAERLTELRRNPRVVGIRNLIHDIPDSDWLLRPRRRRTAVIPGRDSRAFLWHRCEGPGRGPRGIQEYDSCLSRSEEHTSELQSRQYLVCRLLLEEK